MAKHGRRLCESNLCEAKPSQLDADVDEVEVGKGSHDRRTFEQGFTMIYSSAFTNLSHSFCRLVVALVQCQEWHLETSGAFDHSKAWRLN